MKFSIVFMIIVILYILYYISMIARDLYFNNKEVADIGVVEEDEIDISEDARNFQTIDIPSPNAEDNEIPANTHSTENNEEGGIDMNGGYNIDQFIAAANDYTENGEMGEAAEVCNKWVMSV